MTITEAGHSLTMRLVGNPWFIMVGLVEGAVDDPAQRELQVFHQGIPRLMAETLTTQGWEGFTVKLIKTTPPVAAGEQT